MSERVEVLYRIVARTGDIVHTLRDMTRKDVLREAERCDRVFPTQAPHIVIRVTTTVATTITEEVIHADR